MTDVKLVTDTKAVTDAKLVSDAKAVANAKKIADAKVIADAKSSGVKVLFHKNNVGYMAISVGGPDKGDGLFSGNVFFPSNSFSDVEISIQNTVAGDINKGNVIAINCKDTQTTHTYSLDKYVTVKVYATGKVLFTYVPSKN